MRRARTALLSAIAVVPLLAGCQTDRSSGTDTARAPGEITSSATPRSTTATINDPTTGAPAFTDNVERQSGEGSGGSDLVLVDVRVAKAAGFDRIVLEFSGTGTPGWVVNYVDEAVVDGSGEAVALGGTAVLDIYASGSTWPAPDYYRGPSHFTPPEGGEVVDVYVGGTFEGYTQVIAGIDSDPVPFRAFALAAPARLVIDVVDENAD
jgi:hypothetical protein